MIRLQEEEPAIMSMLQWKLDGIKKPLWKEVSQESGDLKALWGLWKSLEVKDGLLCRHFVPEISVKEQENPCVIFQVVAPKAIRQNILGLVHSHKTTDHLEVREMLHSVRQSFYWPGYREDIRRWFRQCRECNLIKPTVESMEHGGPPIEFKAYCRENVMLESPVKSHDARMKDIRCRGR